MIDRHETTECLGIRFYKVCSVRRPNDIPAITKCIKEAVKDGVMPTRIFAEPIKDDDKHVAILYSVPKEELVKDFIRKEDNAERLIEDIIDNFYEELGDDFRNKENKKRAEIKKWVEKIIL